MAPARHPTGEHTDEHRTALFLGPQALAEYRQTLEPSSQLEAEPMGVPQAPHLPPSSPRRRLTNAGAHLHGFIQAVAPPRSMQDVLATWMQHLQVSTGQVLLLPLEICAWLQANQPAGWGQMTVCPPGVALGNDAATGLDTLSVQTTGTWGIATDGQPYFTPDGEVGSGENASLFVSGGVPFLAQ